MTIDTYRARFDAQVGQTVGHSDWVTVDQEMIDRFADVTHDHQYIHVDPDAAASSPFGGTVAHGFLTLSLLSKMAYEAVQRPGPEAGITGVNYGFDKVRFIAPVRSGARIRGQFTLAAVEDFPPGFRLRWQVTVEIEGSDKPALAAEWLGLWLPMTT